MKNNLLLLAIVCILSAICGTGAKAQLSFGSPTNVPVGNTPRSVAIADVNLDGRPDILIANQGSASVSVRLGNGAGGFTGSTNISVGTTPISVAVADVNLDGKPDILTANSISNVGSNNVSVRLGDGTGGFSGTTSIIVGTNPISIVVADVNLDGKPDILTANESDANVSVRLGDGLGGFSGTTSIAVGTALENVVVADVNLDGKPDFLTSSNASNTVSVRLGDGVGGFSGTTDIPVGISPFSLAVADVNLDGKLDLLTANFTSNNVSVRFGDGAGGFSGSTNIAVASGPASVAVADVDADGKPDLLTANLSSSSVSVRVGDGLGGFSGNTNIAIGVNPFSLALADMNGDGKPDFATANFGANSASVVLNTTQALPIINSFNPTSGPDGTSVTIIGTNFDTTPVNNIVAFNGTTSVVTASTATSITTSVPAGATTGKIAVTVGGNTATSTADFNVTQNFITQWNLATAGSDPNKLSFETATSGVVNYTWQEISPGSLTGSGFWSGATLTITGLPPGATIRLQIEATNFQQFSINNGLDRNRLTLVEQWGSTAWTSMQRAFLGCSNLQIVATDVPNLSGVADMSLMFYGCDILNSPSNINSWNTSAVTDMSFMFYRASAFNQNIGSWNTTAVTTMANMFGSANAFNQNIGAWNTAAVTTMNSMFYQASAFNQNIGAWNTAAVTTMRDMFYAATTFNQDISAWNTAAVTRMSGMFTEASAFNQNIAGWNTAAVTSMRGMFDQASAFNQNIGAWNLNPVVDVAIMLNTSGMNCSNYSATLIGWSANPLTPDNRTLGATGRQYGTNAVAARTILIAKGWTITGDTPSGSVCVVPNNNFVTVWNLATPGSGSTQLSFGTATSGAANYSWQEISPGSASGSGSWSSANLTITGLPAGSIIRLQIAPTNFQRININNGADRNRLTLVEQWGNTAWSSMSQAFYGCTNLQVTATDVPNLLGVTNMSYMFFGCTNLNSPSNIGSWNTIAVTNMSEMFVNASAFNQNMGAWNTGAATNMNQLFRNASAFNQDIGAWTLNPGVNLSSMLDNSGMDCNNYSATLIAWSANPSTPTGRTLGAAGRQYGTNAGAARTNLTGTKGWTITGDTPSGAVCISVTCVSALQRAALIKLYNDTGGASWTNNTGWLSANEDDWFGVTVTGCDVTGIVLENNNLINSIPTEIGDLSGLTELNLSHNKLSGTLPATLATSTALEIFDLEDNLLSGTIPSYFSTFPNLYSINLGFNQFSGSIPSNLGSIGPLEFLSLARNQLIGSIPPELGSLTNLTLLDLSRNQLSGSIPFELGSLPLLNSLQLWQNQLTGSIPTQLGAIGNLQYLNLSSNLLTGSIPNSLGGLSNLLSLELNQNQLSGAIPNLGSTSLVILKLSDNMITGSIPTTLSTLSGLVQLDLDRNQLTGILPPELSLLTNLEDFNLYNNQLSGSLPNEYGNLTKLLRFRISNNTISGSVPIQYLAWNDIEILKLDNNLLDDIPTFAAPGITELSVEYNNLDFADLEPSINVQGFTYSPQADLPGGVANAIAGSPLTIPFTANGTANLYQWFKDGALVLGATSPTFSISSAGISDAGNYIVAISSTLATGLTLNSLLFVVTINPLLAITIQPVDITVCDGKAAVFTCNATGANNITYQWQFSPNGSTLTFADIANGPNYSGVTTATLSINTLGTFGEGRYRCRINGDLTTEVITNDEGLFINPTPTAPSTTGNSICGTGVVTLTASGGTNGQYRWYDVATGGTALAGQVNSSFSTPSISTTTTYYVAINNGSCESSRFPVVATINPAPAKPLITISGSTTLCTGQSATLSAPVGFTYSWSTGATSQQIIVSTAGSFSVQITSAGCTSVSSDPIVVSSGACNQPPVIAATTVQAGVEGSVTINLTALLSDPDNNLDLSTLRIIQQPSSGAPASINSNNELIINYQGLSFSGIDELTIEVCDLSGVCVQQKITIDVVGDIIVYNAVSPNDDNKNPAFILKYIDTIEETKNNKVSIFNRWGDLIWEGVNYNNTSVVFTGTNKNGNELPTGTYFYKIEFTSGRKTDSGYLSLKR